jgi:sugar (pentulose or hexulose) kinase
MVEHRIIAVIDIGKTNVKLAIIDCVNLVELAVETTPNRIVRDGPYPHFDTEAIWDFICASLRKLSASHVIDAVSVTTHGASAALVDAAGDLATPVLDYEHVGPDELSESYDALRPPFSETGSPRMAMGLNVGAQLHWLFATVPGLLEQTASILPWPQYWAFRLTGARVADVTSIACHTDLWNPDKAAFSSLPHEQGWLGKLPRICLPGEVVGGVMADVAASTGLRAGTPVVAGIHDSNASLLPHLISREAPFAVVSTGTWVVAMAIGGESVALDPARDTLVNVNALGQPVASAKFMGGREFESVTASTRMAANCVPTRGDIAHVLAERIMLLPAVETRSGPFPGRAMGWTHAPETLGEGERMAALSFYLAMMTATCLTMIGARGPIIAEGPFARNAAFCAMLQAAVGRPVMPSLTSSTGTAIGAALLCTSRQAQAALATRLAPEPPHRAQIDPAMDLYAALWRVKVGT